MTWMRRYDEAKKNVQKGTWTNNLDKKERMSTIRLQNHCEVQQQRQYDWIWSTAHICIVALQRFPRIMRWGVFSEVMGCMFPNWEWGQTVPAQRDPTSPHPCAATMDISNKVDASDVDELSVPEEPQSGQKVLSSFHESTYYWLLTIGWWVTEAWIYAH